MKPIYKPTGAAREYGDYAINIYTGCPHNCSYCYAPSVLRKQKESFHTCVKLRENIVEEVRKQINRENIRGKLIHLCFICDPYPLGYDSSATREIIKILKETGNHVQILTKNGLAALRDFDLLDENDWFGITYAGYVGDITDSTYTPVAEPNAGTPHDRVFALATAHQKGIKTWVSAEPVLNAQDVIRFIENNLPIVDLWKIGQLNYHPSPIDWQAFGKTAEALLRTNGANYYIKDSLRKEMNKE